MTHIHGHFAVPSGGKGSAVLVLHAWWGLNDDVKAFCRRLADAGFVAFAPDLYHGVVVETIGDAETLANTLDADQARADVAAAVQFLAACVGSQNPHIAVVGFSLGAFFALDLSVTHPQQVRSVVVFYGTRPGDYGRSQAEYLGHFAENDEYEPEAEVDSLEAALREAGRPTTFYHYNNVGHWFCEPSRLHAYDQPAAQLAWERTLAFLNRS